MSIPEGSESVTQLKRALVAIKELRGKLDSVERARTEPIAIIGMGCRLPNADHPQAFWHLLRDGVDAISETPAARWDATLYNADPEATGKVATRWGGFLHDIDRFDPAFFGISPREAAAMDPQQRILLEVAYETFEDAGQTTEVLAGSKTGVFVGVHSHSSDYYLLQAADPAAIDTYSGTGTSHSVVAGRISYLFDLQGPSVVLDTACSSSLVAVHQAVQSLRSGECRMALAGGVNIILEPTFTIAASRMRMLAADGRCKTFDAAADGFVRAEGCAAVLLKRLSDAIADGDRVLAVVYGSAVNQDGHTNGLTAPNGLSQQTVIRAALANAGLEPQQISYVEAHGTGTSLGDPIEVEALGAIMGAPKSSDHVCALGSAKANIGHTEGAAGVVGLIKAVLSLQHEAVPPLVHFHTLNPHITLDNTPFVIPTALYPWPVGESPRYAGVSSFGWSGTNAHVIVGDVPQTAIVSTSTVQKIGPFLLPLSARSPDALRALAERYHAFLLADDQQANVGDICLSAATRRSHHDHRLALVGSSRADLAEQVTAFLDGQARAGMTIGRIDINRPVGIVFVFPGQGAQWFGMGRGLLATAPAFRETMERCDAAIRAEAGWSPLEQLTADESHSRLNEIDVVQPTLFAIQVSLAALWRAYGIIPDAVVGHSMGEVAAAHIAGILNLEDATRVICRRSRLLRRVRGQGAMAVVELSIDEARGALAGYENRLAIAVSNSPSSTVLSGDPAALDEVLAQLQQRDVFCRHVKVDVASHSPQMDPLRDDLLVALKELRPQPGSTPFYSTVTSAIEDGMGCDANYWARNLRQPVLFATAIRQLIADGMSAFIEISPHPILLQAIDTTCQHDGKHSMTIASLQRNADEPVAMLGGLGALYAGGVPVDWRTLYPHGSFVPLPNYPWQHERFWLRQEVGRGGRRGAPAHPLLGWRVTLAEGDCTVWENELRKVERPELYDHRIDGVPVLPASAYLEYATAAAKLRGDGPYELTDISFQRAMFLNDDAATPIQIVLAPDTDGQSVRFYSHNNDWTLHASLTIRPIQMQDVQPSAFGQLDLIRARAETTLDGDGFYAALEATGVILGPSLQRVAQVWRGNREVLARIAGSEDATQSLALDACLQLTALAIARNDGAIFMPTALNRARFYAAPTSLMWCNVRSRDERGDDRIVQDITLYTQDGQLVATLEALQLQRFGAQTDGIDRWMYQLEWRRDDRPAKREIQRTGERWLIFADRAGVGAALARQLRATGATCVLAYAGSGYEQKAEASFVIRPQAPGDVRRLLDEALGETPCTGVIHLWSLDTSSKDLTATELETAHDAGCGSVLHLVQALADRHDMPRLWLVTGGAHHVVDSDRDLAVAQASLWGLGRVIAEEHPDLWGGLIDLNAGAGPDDSAALLAVEIGRQDGEDQVALRGNERYLARLVRRTPTPATTFHWRPDATYLLTGGFGALGSQVARWMVRQGARRLILMSRTLLPPRSQWHQLAPDSSHGRRIALVRELESQGASVHLATVDVSDEPQLRSFLDTFRAEGWPPIRGVVHTAAVFESQLLRELDLATFKALMRPKLVGAWLLNQLLGDLDMFVLFSSLAALLPQEGQGNYAAANAALDALAEARRQRGQPAVSINWGVWADVGLIEADAWQRRADQMAAQGIAHFPTERGLEALGLLLNPDQAQVAVVPADWSAFGAARAQARTYPLLADLLAEATTSIPTAHVEVERSLRNRLSFAGPDERRPMLEAHVQAVVAQVLKMSPARIDPARPLGTLGVDSLMAVEIRNRLGADLGLKLSATITWNYPTVTDLTSHLLSKLSPTLDVIAASESSPTPTIQPSAERMSAPLTQIVANIDDLSEDAALLALLGKH